MFPFISLLKTIVSTEWFTGPRSLNSRGHMVDGNSLPEIWLQFHLFWIVPPKMLQPKFCLSGEQSKMDYDIAVPCSLSLLMLRRVNQLQCPLGLGTIHGHPLDDEFVHALTFSLFSCLETVCRVSVSAIHLHLFCRKGCPYNLFESWQSVKDLKRALVI